MSNNTRGARYFIGVWWPVALSVAVIAMESQEFMGADHTSRLLRPIWQAIFGQVSDARWEILHHFIRKTGHFVGYGLIGLAWLRAWWMTLPHSKFLTDAALAMLGTATMASLDEWHQAFLPDRTSSPWDVLLDCAGALALQMLVYVFVRITRPKQLARAA
ncbi:MAG TPA: VanZ family protein [Terracidiphilus sp.]|jgi:VanZ family protein|nr:VanZ family protein [Terracidiphilus sp.]